MDPIVQLNADGARRRIAAGNRDALPARGQAIANSNDRLDPSGLGPHDDLVAVGDELVLIQVGRWI